LAVPAASSSRQGPMTFDFFRCPDSNTADKAISVGIFRMIPCDSFKSSLHLVRKLLAYPAQYVAPAHMAQRFHARTSCAFCEKVWSVCFGWLGSLICVQACPGPYRSQASSRFTCDMITLSCPSKPRWLAKGWMLVFLASSRKSKGFGVKSQYLISYLKCHIFLFYHYFLRLFFFFGRPPRKPTKSLIPL